jgi:hypothetical protein
MPVLLFSFLSDVIVFFIHTTRRQHILIPSDYLNVIFYMLQSVVSMSRLRCGALNGNVATAVQLACREVSLSHLFHLIDCHCKKKDTKKKKSEIQSQIDMSIAERKKTHRKN